MIKKLRLRKFVTHCGKSEIRTWVPFSKSSVLSVPVSCSSFGKRAKKWPALQGLESEPLSKHDIIWLRGHQLPPGSEPSALCPGPFTGESAAVAFVTGPCFEVIWLKWNHSSSSGATNFYYIIIHI